MGVPLIGIEHELRIIHQPGNKAVHVVHRPKLAYPLRDFSEDVKAVPGLSQGLPPPAGGRSDPRSPEAHTSAAPTTRERSGRAE